MARENIKRRDIAGSYSIEQLKREYDFWQDSNENESSLFKERIKELEEGKQEILKSGENIKTINEESILGSGNITIKEEDTGWINLTPLSGTWEYLQYRVINKNHVYVRGYASSLATPSTTGTMIATDIPSDYLPQTNVYAYGHLGGKRMSRWFVTQTGVGTDWAVNISNGNSYTSAVWQSFDIDYYI